jgi:TIR domain
MSAKPVIFISYAHADEPEKPAEGEVQWLTFVCRYLRPAVKDGIFELWVDRYMMGGANWDPEIEQKLRDCDIFILLVSASAMASDYIIDKEIAIIRERQANGDDVHFYPLLLTPTPDAGLKKVRDKNLRPPDAQPLFSFHGNDRLQHMTEAANEIAAIAQQIVDRKGAHEPSPPPACPAYVHITGLPETAYERLVGREKELQRLNDAWADRQTNILSLIAEGGAGKSALVNEWLTNLHVDDYRGAEAVLGWSFYSQGTKEAV